MPTVIQAVSTALLTLCVCSFSLRRHFNAALAMISTLTATRTLIVVAEKRHTRFVFQTPSPSLITGSHFLLIFL